MMRRPPRSTLFPYTPLSQSHDRDRLVATDVARQRRELVELRERDQRRGAPADAVEERHHLRHGRHAHPPGRRSEEHTSELQSRQYLVCRLLLEKKKTK